MTADQLPNTNQTQFIDQELLYERPVKVEPPAPPAAHSQPSSPPAQIKNKTTAQRYKKILLIGGGIIALLVVLVVGMALVTHRRPSSSTQPPAETSELPAEVVGPFQERIKEIDQLLDQADPTQEELPFPAVDLEINLEEE